jgi:hypothetical protein
MKRSFSLLFCAGWLIAFPDSGRSDNDRVVAQALLPHSPDLIAQIHFVGAGPIAADTNSCAFTNLWCSPEARALREQTLNKLSHAPYAWFKSRIAAGGGEEAEKFRPLLDDLLKSEWFFEARDATNGAPELALAIRLDSERAQLWQTNLAGVLESWAKLPVEKRQNGWQLKKHLPPDLVRLVCAGDWVVLGWGQDELPLNDEILQRLHDPKRPVPAAGGYWLDAEIDWPRLARWFSLFEPLGLPETQLRVVGREDGLQLDGKFVFAEPPAVTLEPWRMPTNAMRPPFTSFTAARGLAPWLEKRDWAKPFEIQPVPNQFFVWAIAQMPLQTFAALPVPNATNALAQLEQKLSANTNWQDHFMMPVRMAMTNNQIIWSGMPFISPKVTALHGSAGDFLLAEVFPNGPITEPLPRELLTRLGQTNLIYYHWETTAGRLKQLPQLTQLALLLTRHKQLDSQSAAGQWLSRIGPTLGDAVTEITQIAPKEWSFNRQAPGGLTAIELIALANWLEATNFPGCDLRLPPRRPFKLQKHLPPFQPASTPTSPPAPIPPSSPQP